MYFPNIEKIRYEGPQSKNPLAFKFYDADRVILGKTMKEHLPFAMAWWHNLCAAGTDMFGPVTEDFWVLRSPSFSRSWTPLFVKTRATTAICGSARIISLRPF